MKKRRNGVPLFFAFAVGAVIFAMVAFPNK
jgi:hypothetical protein